MSELQKVYQIFRYVLVCSPKQHFPVSSRNAPMHNLLWEGTLRDDRDCKRLRGRLCVGPWERGGLWRLRCLSYFFFYKNEERTMISEILKKIRMLNLSCEMYVLLYSKEYLKKTELLTQSWKWILNILCKWRRCEMHRGILIWERLNLSQIVILQVLCKAMNRFSAGKHNGFNRKSRPLTPASITRSLNTIVPGGQAIPWGHC